MEQMEKPQQKTDQEKILIHVSGMYELLKVLIIELAKIKDNEISCQELERIIDLSKPAISNNLNRLVKAGILIKEETRQEGRGRKVTYKIKEGGDTIDFIINHLYN